MAGTRRYKLLCPIARALDRIGDRWTLLILRDLHAGPARFSELQTGLSGIAPNLLTDRLQQLIDDGLVEKQAAQHSITLYALTELGRQTKAMLFELAMFGGRFPPDKDRKRPGNLRTVAVTLGEACQRVVPRYADIQAELNIDGERFSLTARNGLVEILYAPAEAPDVTMFTEYEPMIAAAEGELPMSRFLQEHVRMDVHTPGKDQQLMSLLGAAMTVFAD
ncbi:MAG: helix-turn-helix transcriptional regulator [Hyphomicrobiales bacterium]|nr:helix-turn-helix transcriptional regulator [Hyphomicrobiales bacterium]